MQLKKLKEFHNQVRTEENTIHEHDKDHNCINNLKPREGPRAPKFAKYTPLNVDHSRFLEEALKAEILPTRHKIPSSK